MVIWPRRLARGSLSSWRAWIEMIWGDEHWYPDDVALLMESVD